MTLILNFPETFAAESLAGFVAANARGSARRRAAWSARPSGHRARSRSSSVVAPATIRRSRASWVRLAEGRSAGTCSPPRRPAR